MGVDILLVREINQLMESTKVHRAPSFIVGLINLRGQIVTIFNLAERLNMHGKPGSPGPEQPHNIILKSNSELISIRQRERREDLIGADEMVGLRVDDIGDVMDLEDEKIGPIPANIRHSDHRFLLGVVPLENELLLILDVRAVLLRDLENAA
jgi:purine-binding chemotaxis protein CheW